jgi:hypothetical protein
MTGERESTGIDPATGDARPDAFDASGVTPSDVRVPQGVEAYECPHCGRLFPRERYRDLHRGQAHPAALSEAEVDAYRAATDDEWDDLRRFRIVALGALVVLYFGFLLAFAVFA